MKLSLLELTQDILSSMDSDEVNSISDTSESRQVTKIIRTAYFNILSRANLPEHKTIFSLDSSGEADQPVLMTKPSNVSSVDWIKYNKFTADDSDPKWDYVTIVPVQQFFDWTHQFDTSESNVDSMELNGQTFYYTNNHSPSYCTILEDFYLIFDSYDIEVDSTLQSIKTMVSGIVYPTFTFSNDFIPDLDEQQFPLLLNEAKSLAFFELKQQPHPKAEQESRRQWTTLQRTKSLGPPTSFDSLPNFGRTRNRVRFNGT